VKKFITPHANKVVHDKMAAKIVFVPTYVRAYFCAQALDLPGEPSRLLSAWCQIKSQVLMVAAE
jgi:hypothetical protein